MLKMSGCMLLHDDELIGYVGSIKKAIRDDLFDLLDEADDLLLCLDDYSWDDLVKVTYHPMGSWIVKKIEIVEVD